MASNDSQYTYEDNAPASEFPIASVYAVVYYLENRSWVVSGEGWAQVQLLRDQMDGSHRVVAWTVDDNEVVMNVNITSACVYKKKTDDFHKLYDENEVVWGFGFYQNDEALADARKLLQAVLSAIEADRNAQQPNASASAVSGPSSSSSAAPKRDVVKHTSPVAGTKGVTFQDQKTRPLATPPGHAKQPSSVGVRKGSETKVKRGLVSRLSRKFKASPFFGANSSSNGVSSPTNANKSTPAQTAAPTPPVQPKPAVTQRNSTSAASSSSTSLTNRSPSSKKRGPPPLPPSVKARSGAASVSSNGAVSSVSSTTSAPPPPPPGSPSSSRTKIAGSQPIVSASAEQKGGGGASGPPPVPAKKGGGKMFNPGTIVPTKEPTEHKHHTKIMEDIYVNGVVPLGKLKILPAKHTKKLGQDSITDPYSVMHTRHVKFDPQSRSYQGLPPEWESQLKRQFGLNISEVERMEVSGYAARIPIVLVQMKDYLFEHNGHTVEGIFRLAPNQSECVWVKRQLNENTFESCQDINCIANLIKVWFRELPVHLLDGVKAEDIMAAESPESAGAVIETMKDPAKSTYEWLLDFCVEIAQYEEYSKMGAKNLAIVIGPNLFAPTPEMAANPMVALQYSQKVAAFFHQSILYRKQLYYTPVEEEQQPAE